MGILHGIKQHFGAHIGVHAADKIQYMNFMWNEILAAIHAQICVCVPLKEDRISCRGWFYWYSTMWNTIDTIFGNEGYLVSDADPSRVSSINQDPNNIFSDFVLLDRFLLFSTSWISFYFIIIIYIKNDVYFKSTVIGWRRFNKSLSNKLKVPQDLLNFVSLGPPYNIVGTRNNMPYWIHNYLTVSTHQYKKFNTNLKHTHLTLFHHCHLKLDFIKHEKTFLRVLYHNNLKRGKSTAL